MGKQIELNAAGLAYSEIKRMIMLKELRPGQRLAENALSDQIGVSRTPVREALRKLCSEGWVSMIQNSGVWVAAPSKHEIFDAYEVRSKLETWGIEKAMPNITPLLIRRLEENLDDENSVYLEKKSESYPDVNNRFHLLIAEASGNEVLCRHIETALSQTLIYMTLYEDYFDFENNCSLSEHTSILDSIKKRDEKSVINKMQAHILQGFHDLKI
ncbi:MAG: GntR family transcriptional regulator [Synergistaceae bacterium]|nr:GntR family transcriptional regulator [Synergistaceae bacterium]